MKAEHHLIFMPALAAETPLSIPCTSLSYVVGHVADSEIGNWQEELMDGIQNQCKQELRFVGRMPTELILWGKYENMQARKLREKPQLSLNLTCHRSPPLLFRTCGQIYPICRIEGACTWLPTQPEMNQTNSALEHESRWSSLNRKCITWQTY